MPLAGPLTIPATAVDRSAQHLWITVGSTHDREALRLLRSRGSCPAAAAPPTPDCRRTRMTQFDVATAAVEAALAAGARYADARVMHRRYESMTALNGEIEELSQDEDAGLGVRALVGSGWGFFAAPDLESARDAGARAAGIAAGSASVAG